MVVVAEDTYAGTLAVRQVSEVPFRANSSAFA